MRHVAALAGVGIKTVSRVVNANPNVSQETVDRVREAIERLDYQPDLNAGNLKRANGKTLTIGLVVESVANPISSAIHRAIEQKAWNGIPPCSRPATGMTRSGSTPLCRPYSVAVRRDDPHDGRRELRVPCRRRRPAHPARVR